MDQTAKPSRAGVAGDDLSALAWVHGELRRSLENAHKSLRRYLKESEAIGGSDVDSVDPSILRSARSHFHQGVGALELIGLPSVAGLLRAAEAAVQRLSSRPRQLDAKAVETIERASFAAMDFLSRELAGKAVSPVMLFPQYRAAQELAAADRVHPADLWPLDFHWHDLAAEPGVAPRASDDTARGQMEALVLALMRGGDRMLLAQISAFCAELGAGAAHSRQATLWRLAAAVFEAQARGRLTPDVYTKRLASRLLAQLRLAVRGQHEVTDRLAHDLLFFCAHAAADGAPAPRLMAVRAAWRLDAHPSADYETARLGRFDPAWITLARKRVASAKETWSAVAGGELHRIGTLNETFALVGESLTKLFSSGDVLSQSLLETAARTVAAGEAPAPALAMEVATAVLYVDASIEDGEFDHPDLSRRMTRLAQRIDEVRSGAAAQPLEPWMEELYRRVSDRQTMGSVVQELRATLSEVEKQIDQYFRDPADRQVLIPVPAQLSAMRGVLSVLGMDQASQAVLHMRDDIDALAQTEVDPKRAIQTGTFDRVADNLGALSFLIDMLSVQPALAKSLFRFDPATGSLAAVMGQSERVSAFSQLDTQPAALAATPEPAPTPSLPLPEQVREVVVLAALDATPDAEIEHRLERLAQQAFAAEQTALARTAHAAHAALRAAPDARGRAAQRRELTGSLSAFMPAPVAAPPAAPLPPPKTTPAAAPGGTGLEDDAEMREIFIEEAREVVTEARAALDRLADAPESSTEMTTVRRAFHTLKGSSRMVGLRDFGDAAWACEQLYNSRLAQAPRMDAPLRQITGEALAYFESWVEAIAAGRDAGHRSVAVARAADALRLEGTRLPIEPAQAPAEQPLEAELPTLPDVAELVPAAPRELAEPALPVLSEPVAPESALPPFALPIELPTLDLGTVIPPSTPGAPEPAPELPLVREAPAASFDFELELPGAGETPQARPEPESLTARVPDLPQAGELDLGPPAARTPERAPRAAAEGRPEATPEVVVPEVAFELDLHALDESAAAEAAPMVQAAPIDVQLDFEPAPALPVPDVQAVEAAGLNFDLGRSTEVEATAPFERAAVPPAFAGQPLPPTPAMAPEAVAPRATSDDDQVKVIGPLRIAIPLFNIFLNEADEQSRRLVTELAEWAVDPLHHPVPESSVALAHSLAGNSATVGYADLSALARALEHALERSQAVGLGRPGEAELFGDAADQVRHLLHQFAAGFLRPVPEDLMLRLADHERWPAEAVLEPAPDETVAFGPVPVVETEAAARAAPAAPALRSVSVSAFAPLEPADEGLSGGADAAREDEEDLDAVDAVDGELFPIFEEEAAELLPQLQARLRDWHDRPGDRDAPAACMRTLHTFKGGARLAGAMRLGEMAHRLETAIERLAAHDEIPLAEIDPLLVRSDAMAFAFDALRRSQHGEPVVAAAPAAPVAPAVPAVASTMAKAAPAPADAAPVPTAPAVPTTPLAPVSAGAPSPAIDWQRFARAPAAAEVAAERAGGAAAAVTGAAAGPVVRVRAGLLDRLVNAAGEVSITRERIAADTEQLQSALSELTDSLERMRRQLRDIELQAETQISSRMETARVAGQAFDALEMDRFTRFQELTRFMAESVNDVATLQRGLKRTLQSTEDELAMQARLTRDLQDDLLRTRMVEFESLAERLYRTVRQAAKDVGKQVRLDIVGGAIEIDRGVLERMVGAFEHLLRNSVAHGIETAAERAAAGKDAVGRIQIQVSQAGNEVAVEFGDDGAGFDYERIRRRGIERGLLAPDAQASEADLAQLLFQPGFSTADGVTELAGRGVGLDVVRAEVNAMGGRIETASAHGQGTRFRLLLPLTTAVTQIVMLRCGPLQVAVPSTLVEVVRRVPTAEAERAYSSAAIEHGGEIVPFFWLGALLQSGARGELAGRAQVVVVIRSATQRVAVHVDEVVGNNEVVVKNVGPQLARLPGLAGVTLLPSGAVALIYNPVALATLYAEQARELMRLPAAGAPVVPVEAAPAGVHSPMVLVVDDSLTVRRVTQRLLVREGYRVVTAKDGLEALERLAEERPAILLTDIEMPRMDGFDLVRNVRADERLADLPVVMITSRIAQKHRDYAAALGVDHYLGKPYAEDELLSIVARYTGADIVA